MSDDLSLFGDETSPEEDVAPKVTPIAGWQGVPLLRPRARPLRASPGALISVVQRENASLDF